MLSVVIKSCGIVSALGDCEASCAVNLEALSARVDWRVVGGRELPCFPIRSEVSEAATVLLQQQLRIDRSVALGVLAARRCTASNHSHSHQIAAQAVVMGSSRGAAGTYERELANFLKEGQVGVSARTSPMTTLGCFASAIACDQGIHNSASDISMTCSSGLLSIALSMDMLKGREDLQLVLAGAAESPLTPFTFAQMQALGIYSRLRNDYPCEPTGISGDSTFVLGEAAVVLALEKVQQIASGDLVILGCGVARDQVSSPTGISVSGSGFQSAMQQALAQAGLHGVGRDDVELVIVHAPGTLKGDRAELNAVGMVFERTVSLYSSKWLTGHTFAVSGMLGLVLGLHYLKGGVLPAVPFASQLSSFVGGGAKRKVFMVNAAGFGGTAVSLIIGRF